MQNAITNINGEIFDQIEQAKISIFDRGYLYGDSIYEVIRSYGGKFFLLDEHLKRLENSARLCQMTINQSSSLLKEEIYRSFNAFQRISDNKGKEAYARIMVSRGVGKLGFSQSLVSTPTQYVILILPLVVPTPKTYQQGIKLKISSSRIRNDRRALDPAMKSGNYLNSVLAFIEAENEDFDDALLCNLEGQVTEGTTFNIFYVKRGIVVTPPLDIGILEGITRRLVLRLLDQLEIPFREVRFPKERLYEADEVFLTGSVKEVLAVTQVDRTQIGKGYQGELTKSIRRAYEKAIGEKNGS